MERQVEGSQGGSGVGFKALESGDLAEGGPVVDEVGEAQSGIGRVKPACSSSSFAMRGNEGIAQNPLGIGHLLNARQGRKAEGLTPTDASGGRPDGRLVDE